MCVRVCDVVRRQVCQLALQMLNLVQYMHSRNLLHRDIKPANFVMGVGVRSSSSRLFGSLCVRARVCVRVSDACHTDVGRPFVPACMRRRRVGVSRKQHTSHHIRRVCVNDVMLLHGACRVCVHVCVTVNDRTINHGCTSSTSDCRRSACVFS